MSTSAETVPVEPAELADRATRILVDRGADAAGARVQAEHLVEAELRGHPSHGVRRLATIVARIEAGLLDPSARPRLRWVGSGALRADGARGFGPVAAYAAVDALLERAPQAGVAVAALSSTHHLGMLAPYVERMAEAGCVGIVVSSTEGLVHPWGGAGALVGTNPLGIGVAADEGDLVLDMSTGAVSAGKILDYRARGMALPPGWAVDADGRPTTDAAAAVDGAISPFGGAKGYALGVALGAVVAALTGTALGPDVHGTLDSEWETTKGDVIIALHAETIAGADSRASLREYFDLIRASGADASVPGDRARTARSRASSAGVAIPADVWNTLLDLEQSRSAR